jgi:DNA invertase Pin-like site-specific DNA recombinase
MTKRVVCYVRCSTKDQNVTRQLEELREVASNHNWVIVDEYADIGISGSKKNRPELDRLLKDAMSRKFELVMTLELSRLGRSVSNMCQIVEILKSKKIDLFIKNQNIDTSSIVGEFFFNIMNSISQYERELITERVVSGLESARKKGRIGGRPTNLTDDIKLKVMKLKEKGIGIKKIAKECSIGIQSVYKVFNENKGVSVEL